jgi:hypothetical protein
MADHAFGATPWDDERFDLGFSEGHAAGYEDGLADGIASLSMYEVIHEWLVENMPAALELCPYKGGSMKARDAAWRPYRRRIL